MSNWTEYDHMSPEQERDAWESEEAYRLTGQYSNESFVDRLKPVLLRALIGVWSDGDEIRQRAGINVGAIPATWKALSELVIDGLAEYNGLEQYRLTDAGRTGRDALINFRQPEKEKES